MSVRSVNVSECVRVVVGGGGEGGGRSRRHMCMETEIREFGCV